ncbi:17930_t:CDS:10 [Funneliformis geosporum]|uniref:ATP-dependent (S)-NAD(P)H-hydrate dehydratase n=1 Tax=Funneliformis geosporum TaxID=1117311 RepID=A0A9W4SPX4_9GLOM|nr:17930_t:CDS:10 [Funneliformis geosporum]CAI2178386.1 9855_t:CDS:10 [Funneliformis geosporum]
MSDNLTLDEVDIEVFGQNYVFEGPEKLLEIWFGPSPDTIPNSLFPNDNDDKPPPLKTGLRLVERVIWNKFLELVKCEVLNVINNDYMDAYLLSESSMFIYPHKIILKTCGTTTLLVALPRLLEIASEYCHLHKVWRVFYSRKSFMFPERQSHPHKNWNEEVKFLDQLFENGAAYTVGKINGDHWFLWLASSPDEFLSHNSSRLKEPSHIDTFSYPLDEIDQKKPPIIIDLEDQTIEILMTELSTTTLSKFYHNPLEGESGTEGGVRIDQKTGLCNLYPEAQLDSYLFKPCGYSANGLVGDSYFNVHVTPEPICSYASFETNIPVNSGSIMDIIRQVIAIFEPGKFSVTVFKTQEGDFDKKFLVESIDVIDGFSRKDRILYELDAKPAIEKIRQLIPPLLPEFHKGQAGRICVVGGSEEYTGAPYFSSFSALKLGADIAFVVCEPTAALAIKNYAPDLMVHPYMRQSGDTGKSLEEVINNVTGLFPRTHVLIVGPGLSRDKMMLESAKGIITKAKEKNLPLVIDADGLFLIQNHPEIIKDYPKAILTPNIVEFKRLCDAMNIKLEGNNKDDMIGLLGQAFGGVTIVQKGQYDLISNGKEVFKVDDKGGLKRCGGQGDILTGLIATFLAWGSAYHDKLWQHDNSISPTEIPMLASYAACTLMRECSRSAFEKFGRAVQTSDMINEIGPSFQKLYER